MKIRCWISRCSPSHFRQLHARGQPVPYCRGGAAVSAAADAATRLWRYAAAERLCHLRLRRRGAADEARRAAGAGAVRLPYRADLERRARRRDDGRVRRLPANWPVLLLDAILFTGGFFRSLQFTAFNAIAYGDMPRPRMSAATRLYSTIQQLTLTLGIVVGAFTLELSARLQGHDTAMKSDYAMAFMMVSAVAMLAAPFCARLKPDAGEALSGHHAARRRRQDQPTASRGTQKAQRQHLHRADRFCQPVRGYDVRRWAQHRRAVPRLARGVSRHCQLCRGVRRVPGLRRALFLWPGGGPQRALLAAAAERLCHQPALRAAAGFGMGAGRSRRCCW